MSKELEVGEEYLSSLADLNVNSKPLINMLTILAEENIQHAGTIVQAIEHHLAKVSADVKLPILYLIDSIVKNVQGEYKQLFSQCIVNLFCGVFEQVNEKTREKLFALRQTWADVFPHTKLWALDIKVNKMDPGWPIIAPVPQVVKSPAIHVNPNFFKSKESTNQVTDDVQAQLREKQRKLLELQKRKLELELVATKKQIEEQEREITNIVGVSSTVPVPANNTLVNETTPHLASTTIAPSRSLVFNHSLIPPPQTTPLTVTAGIGPKIRVAPVNPALISTMRSRDPRLARKNTAGPATQQSNPQQLQPPHHLQMQQPPPPSLLNLNNSQHMLNNLNGSMNNQQNNLSTNMHHSNLNSKQLPKIPKFSRNIDRNTNSNNMGSGLGGNGGGKSGLSSPSKQRRTATSSTKSSSTTTSSKSRSSSNRSSKDTKQRSSGSSDEKKKSRKRSPSPASSPGGGVGPTSSRHKSSSEKSPRHSSTTNKSSPNKFKDVKTSVKNRNYRNRDHSRSRSVSPQPVVVPVVKEASPAKQDVDLRIPPTTNPLTSTTSNEIHQDVNNVQLSPPTTITTSATPIVISDTTASLLAAQNKITESLIDAAAKDVDLRQLPAAIIPLQTTPSSISSISTNLDSSPDSKKRQPSKGIEAGDEPLSKKSKTEKLDELFGSEDVDLRRLQGPTSLQNDVNVIRPITPPPPVISNEVTENLSWAKLKGDPLKKQVTPPSAKSNLDMVRAKLSEVSKTVKSSGGQKSTTSQSSPDEPSKKSSPSRRSFSKTFNKELKRQRDMLLSDDTSSQDCNDANIKIMMEQAEEQLTNKNIDMEEYGNMIKQIFEINESKKIREAERRELIKRKGKSSMPNDLTPISDEEIGFSSGSDGEKKVRRAMVVDVTNKKAEDKARLRFKKKKDVEPTAEATVTCAPKIESSYAKSTAAELRNNERSRGSNSDMKGRWGPWTAPPSNNKPVQQPAWNNLINPINVIQPIVVDPVVVQQQQQPIQPFAPIHNPWPNAMAAVAFNQPAQIMQGPAPQTQLVLDATNQCVLKEDVRTISIDQVPREIRFYDDIAIAFMNWDEPKEIGFQMGKRRVTVDDKDTIVLGFNEPYKSFTIENKIYEIRFGSPTRELYINNKWYECYFGDPPIGILLDNKMRVFKVEGPAPAVKIGNLRQDLVVGRITLIIDAKETVPIFLDAKVQYFEIDGQTNTLQFADYLLTVLINNEPMSVEFGGLPKSLFVRGQKHFVRFTALPDGVMPGKAFIRNMIRTNLHRDVVSPPAPAIVSLNDVPQADPLPPPPTTPIILPGLDALSSLMSSKPTSSRSSFDTIKDGSAMETPSVAATNTGANNPLGNINIGELYQKLLASGILAAGSKTPVSAEKLPKDDKKVTPINLSTPETIKTRQSGIIHLLFSGMQCSSCGVRFPPEQTMKYSQHLDWHFRQNRRERDSARRAHSRRWYYDVSDWIQYEEIEDLEEREKNWFETQQTEMDLGGEDSNHKSESPVPSCPAGTIEGDKTCAMCHDAFDQFYNEETEEWHLRQAVRVDEKTYHPICYEDYKASLILEESALNASEVKGEDGEGTDSQDDSVVVVKTEKTDSNEEHKNLANQNGGVNVDDDDDDVIEITPQEPSITEILDEDEDMPDAEKSTQEEKTENEESSTTTADKPKEDAIAGESDPDIEIQEPHIPITDLDDIEDNPISSLSIDETTQFSNGSPFTNIKIKEEPKDDDEMDEEDAFEDVGTVVAIPIQSDGDEDEEYVPEIVVLNSSEDPTSKPSDSTSSVLKMSENIQPSSNRIKINITKSVKPQSITVITSSAVPAVDKSSTDNILGGKGEDQKGPDDEDKNPDIEFEYKESLRNVNFTKIDKIKSGYETSGLCSIM